MAESTSPSDVFGAGYLDAAFGFNPSESGMPWPKNVANKIAARVAAAIHAWLGECDGENWAITAVLQQSLINLERKR